MSPVYTSSSTILIACRFFPLLSSEQVWFKNRRAKVRQQATHQQSSNVSLKSGNRSTASSASSATSSSRHGSNTSASAGNSNSTNNNNNNNSKSNATGISSSGATKSNTSLKHTLANSATSSSSNSHLAHHNPSTNSNNNSMNTNGLSGIGHNSSPILPMTPTSSVSPPVNVICKKEVNTGAGGYHTGASVPGLSDIMKSASIHDSIKEEMGMVAHNPAAYANINARLGHGGNLTPLGSNSSAMTTSPSPPMTPSQNALSYVPNHDTYFWHPSQYANQYPNNYNTSASYYSQMDYPSQSNYSMGHSAYNASNLGLTSSSTFNGSMTTQAFASNSIDYMTPQDKYVNMVWDFYGDIG